MAGGAIIGGAAGAFGYPQYSDEKGKINISRTGGCSATIPIIMNMTLGLRVVTPIARYFIFPVLIAVLWITKRT